MSLTTTLTSPLAGPSALRDLIRPQFHQNNFLEENYVKNELGIKLDKGVSVSVRSSESLFIRVRICCR